MKARGTKTVSTTAERVPITRLSANAYGIGCGVGNCLSVLPSLVVAAIHLTLRVKNAPPVLRFELSLSVHVDLHLDGAALLAHRDCVRGHSHNIRRP